jgi:transposase-like protein
VVRWRPRQHSLEEHKLCLLVLIGVRVDGRKELVALADGYRESAESWSDLLRDCKRRGMRAPVAKITVHYSERI